MPNTMIIGEPPLRSLLKRLGGICVALGTGSIAIGQGFASVLGGYSAILQIVGGSVASLGIVASLVGHLWIRRNPRLDQYRARRLNSSEIDALQSVQDLYAAGEVTSAKEKQELVSVNPNLFYGVEKIRPHATPQIVGYYVVYPLKKGAVTSLEEGGRSRWYGENAKASELATARGRAAGFYVGFLWANGGRARAATIRLLIEDLASRCKKNDTYKVFARPMTEDGLRLARQHGFRQPTGNREPELRRVCYRLWDPNDYR